MKKFLIISLFPLLLLFANTAWCLPYADSVIDFTPGGHGWGVEVWNSSGSSYTGPSGEFAYDSAAVLGAPDGVSLALGFSPAGVITLGFAGSIIDGAGDDLIVYDSFGLEEGFDIEISQDGSMFYYVGNYSGLTSSTVTETFSFGTSYATYVDISSAAISSASYIKLTATPQVVYNFPEAFDLDAVQAINYTTEPVPEPATMLLLGSGLVGLMGFRRKFRKR